MTVASVIVCVNMSIKLVCELSFKFVYPSRLSVNLSFLLISLSCQSTQPIDRSIVCQSVEFAKKQSRLSIYQVCESVLTVNPSYISLVFQSVLFLCSSFLSVQYVNQRTLVNQSSRSIGLVYQSISQKVRKSIKQVRSVNQ